MNLRPYSANAFCQEDVSGLTMQAMMVWNSPLEVGAIDEYGVVTISMMDTDNDFPTSKRILEYNDSLVKSISI
jgi:hypothetical protein